MAACANANGTCVSRRQRNPLKVFSQCLHSVIDSFDELESNKVQARSCSSKQSAVLTPTRQSGTLFEWGSARAHWSDDVRNNKRGLH
jgi:hypothetical protein